MKTYYEILSVPPEADQDAVKFAFRRAVKAAHPDVNGGDRLAEQRSKQINRAYEVLKDPKRRERYDAQLRSKRSRLRMLAITMVISAGLVSSGTLILLSFFIKSDTAAPTARLSTPPDRVANATDLAAPREDRALPRSPAATASASEDAGTVQLAPERQAAWQKIETAGAPEEIWAFIRANPGTPEAALAAKRLQKLVEAANERAKLSQDASASAQPDAPVEPAAIAAAPASTSGPASAVADAEPAPDESPRPSAVPNPPSIAAAVLEAQPADHREETKAETPAAAAVAEAAAPSAPAVADSPVAVSPTDTAGGAESVTAALPDQSGAEPQAQILAVTEHPRQAEHSALARETGASSPARPQSATHQTLSATLNGDFIIEAPNARTNAPIAPGNSAYYLHRAAALVGRGELGRAMSDYDAAILLDEANIAAFHERGLLHWRRGETELALADFDRAIRLSFSDPRIYLDRGKLWYERGRYDRAIADFNQAIKLSPELASAYSYRGTALRRKGEFKSAIADLDQAIRLNPSIPEAYTNLDLARTERADPLDPPAEAKN